MTNQDPKVTVLGLGRMGCAIAHRLIQRGTAVTGWSRSGAIVDGATPAADPAEAVHGADLVLLTLYDAEACRAVLDRCLPHTPTGCTVVNLSTVAPAEAVDLHESALRAGRRYLHCPVLGSVPAVTDGSLTLLAGDPDLVAMTEGVLADLGRITPVDDAPTAARLKLLANGVLADTVVDVGTALARGTRLGLDRTTVLDVLQRTTLGGLVAAKRAQFDGADTTVTFAAGALVKDIDLLAGIDPTGLPLLETLQDAAVPDDADIAAISADLGATEQRPIDSSSNLYAEMGIRTDEDLLKPLISYARGHATGNPDHFRDAFRPTAHVEGIRDEEFVSWDVVAYCDNFTGQPADDESFRSRTLTALQKSGSIAHATMLLEHGPAAFTDMFVLVREDDSWRIANKVYHRVDRTDPASAAVHV